MAKTPKYYIGCSGYYYSSWKNIFYPKGLAAKDWLIHYSSVFNTIELNGTFYKVPLVATLKKYISQTPDDFSFAAKVNKLITHNYKLNNCKDKITEFIDLMYEGLGHKLYCLLFQMPPSFHYNEENLSRVLENVPHQPSNIIEFRHASWWNSNVEKVLKKAKISFCNVDFPGLKSFMIQTTGIFYFRFHGNPELFKTPYSDDTLKKFREQFPTGCDRYHIYFNNTYHGAAYENALTLRKMIEGY